VTAMHDPTEGGLMAAVWELAEACGHTLVIDPLKVIVPDICAKVCKVFDLDPMATIASGALLLTCPAADAAQIEISLQSDGIACATIGQVEPGNAVVWQLTRAGRVLLPRPDRDQIGKVFR
jgi:hydrogenase expression/formation protein HypE